MAPFVPFWFGIHTLSRAGTGGLDQVDEKCSIKTLWTVSSEQTKKDLRVWDVRGDKELLFKDIQDRGRLCNAVVFQQTWYFCQPFSETVRYLIHRDTEFQTIICHFQNHCEGPYRCPNIDSVSKVGFRTFGEGARIFTADKKVTKQIRNVPRGHAYPDMYKVASKINFGLPAQRWDLSMPSLPAAVQNFGQRCKFLQK